MSAAAVAYCGSPINSPPLQALHKAADHRFLTAGVICFATAIPRRPRPARRQFLQFHASRAFCRFNAALAAVRISPHPKRLRAQRIDFRRRVALR